MVRVIRAPEAQADIIAATRETQNMWGVAQARKYRQLIEAATRIIAQHPKIGRSYGNIRSGIRGYHLKAPARHSLFYRSRSKQTVEIVRFLHDSMDIDRELKLSVRVAQL